MVDVVRAIQASAGADILNAISRLSGCPVVVTDPRGAFLALPACHPASCPLHETAAPAGCPLVASMQDRLKTLQGPQAVTYRGVRHVITPLGADGGLKGLVIADGWAPTQSRRHRQVSPAHPERMRQGAVLASTVLGQLLRMQRQSGPVSVDGPLQSHRPARPVSAGRMPSERLRQMVSQGRLSPRGLTRLRYDYRLTWREIEIVALYYLAPAWPGADDEAGGARRALARRLGITEGTLRAYLNGIRGKLGLRARRGALAFWLWARAEGILAPDVTL